MKSMKRSLIPYAPYATALVLAVAMKYYYSVAEAEDLRWVLSPTSWIVERLTGIHFQWEEQTGFVSSLRTIIIAPACAGLNFLIIAFATLFFTTARQMPSGKWRFLWLGITLAISYILTLGVNSLRIGAAIYLYEADIYHGWFTRESVHRLEGTLIYFSSLLIAHRIVSRTARRFISRRPETTLEESVLTPFLWYCLIALGIPLLNNAWPQGGSRFIEHCAMVILACAAVLLLFVLLPFLRQFAAIRIRVRRGGDSKHEEV